MCFLVPLTSYDANNTASVAPNLNILTRNAVVPLMITLASHDADACANGIT